MSRCNSCLIIYLACAIALLAGVPATEKAKDYGLPYRPLADELCGGDRNELKGMDEPEFARLTLDDPLLKRAYLSVFMSPVGPNLDYHKNEPNPALADLRRRGDSVTPMLLKLMNENQETGLETCILVRIPSAGTIKLEPYLDYARKLLRERTQTMSASLAESAAMLLAAHGTEEDAELLEWVMETRPYVADSVTRELDELNRRLGLPKTSPRRAPKGQITTGGATSGNPQGPAGKPSGPTGAAQPFATWWLVWVVVLFGAVGLLWLMLKKR